MNELKQTKEPAPGLRSLVYLKMKKSIQQSVSFLLILFMSSCYSVPFPLSQDFIKSEMPSNNVSQSLLVRFQNRDSRTKTVLFMQSVETGERLVFNRDNFSISGSNKHVKLFLGENNKLKRRNEIIVTSKSVLIFDFKTKKKAGDTIRIVERCLNAKDDSIVVNIRIPKNGEEWNSSLNDKTLYMYKRMFNSF